MGDPKPRVGTATVLGAELQNRPPPMDSDFSIDQSSDLGQKYAAVWTCHQR